MRSSGRAANLRALLLDDQALHERVSHLVEEVRRQSLLDPRGTRLGSLMLESSVLSTFEGAKVLKKGSREVVLPNDIYRLLVASFDASEPYPLPRTPISPRALRVTRAAIRHAPFSPTSERDRDSHVLFRTTTKAHAVGRIAYMFLHERGSGTSAEVGKPALYLVIEPYQRLLKEEQWMDKSFRTFKRGGFCCKPLFEEKVIIGASDVLCHVAKTPYSIEGVSQPLLQMLPLGKVSPSASTIRLVKLICTQLAEVLPQLRAADLLYVDEHL